MFASMAGQNINILDKLSSGFNIYKSYRSGIFGNIQTDLKVHYDLYAIYELYTKNKIPGSRILEIGCGQKATQTALFSADGAKTTGIDIEIPTYKINLSILIKIIKENGAERAIKSFIRHTLFDKKYINQLSACYKNVSFDFLDIKIMNACNLRFPDNHFDFIFSNVVFEHIDNVPLAVKEVNRVLKPDGIAWIKAHLFPSLSGGHHLEWAKPDDKPSQKVPPWDHLLNNRFPVNTYLNKLKKNDYLQIFNNTMKVVDIKPKIKGENILTPVIYQKLQDKGYTKEDLITSSIAVTCKKALMI